MATIEVLKVNKTIDYIAKQGQETLDNFKKENSFETLCKNWNTVEAVKLEQNLGDTLKACEKKIITHYNWILNEIYKAAYATTTSQSIRTALKNPGKKITFTARMQNLYTPKANGSKATQNATEITNAVKRLIIAIERITKNIYEVRYYLEKGSAVIGITYASGEKNIILDIISTFSKNVDAIHDHLTNVLNQTLKGISNENQSLYQSLKNYQKSHLYFGGGTESGYQQFKTVVNKNGGNTTTAATGWGVVATTTAAVTPSNVSSRQAISGVKVSTSSTKTPTTPANTNTATAKSGNPYKPGTQEYAKYQAQQLAQQKSQQQAQNAAKKQEANQFAASMNRNAANTPEAKQAAQKAADKAKTQTAVQKELDRTMETQYITDDAGGSYVTLVPKQSAVASAAKNQTSIAPKTTTTAPKTTTTKPTTTAPKTTTTKTTTTAPKTATAPSAYSGKQGSQDYAKAQAQQIQKAQAQQARQQESIRVGAIINKETKNIATQQQKVAAINSKPVLQRTIADTFSRSSANRSINSSQKTIQKTIRSSSFFRTN